MSPFNIVTTECSNFDTRRQLHLFNEKQKKRKETKYNKL